jgi:LPS-assembly lipoprotein
MIREIGVRRMRVNILAGLMWAAALTGCGFQLRGQAQLPFESAHVEAIRSSTLAPALRASLSSQNKLAAKADGAAVRILLADEARGKTILALSGGGKVREYRLSYRVVMAVLDAQGKELGAPSEIVLNRDFSYSDAEILAKGAEEATLYRAMEQDALRQVLRRLSYVRR